MAGAEEERKEERAQQLVDVVASLGPTFIKIGQALSIRTDILPPVYSRALQSLQDRVPPFDTALARSIVEDELGLGEGGLSKVYASFSDEPVASASIGQVYKARLASDGTEVAVKVQRPDTTEIIACDLFLIRSAEPLLRRLLPKPCIPHPKLHIL